MAGIHHRTRGNREAGQALYVTAVFLVVVVGLLGLGIDMGTLRYQKRLEQTAADAAAIAGANDLQYSGATGATVAAQAASATNGFADSGTGGVSDCGASASVGTVCVQVNDPPQESKTHNGNPNYVEVLVAAVQPTYFMRIFGVKKETVTARAVATNVGGGPNTPCLLALSASASALVVNGTITLNACSIIVNGNIQINGTIQAVNGGSIEVAGQCSGGSGACSGVVKIPAMADPLAGLSTPPPSGCQPSGGLLGLLLNFCNGLIGGGDLSLTSNVYLLTNGLSLQTGTLNLLNSAGATAYAPNGTINVGAGATLSAPDVTILAQSVTVSGTLNLSIDGNGSSPITNAVLVE